MLKFSRMRSLLTVAVLLTSILTATISHAQGANEVTLANGNTDFALKLYQAAKADADGNILFSPYSISQALAMTYAGAKANTASQMAKVLSFTLPQDQLPPAFLALNTGLNERGNAEANKDLGQSERILKVANALWGQQGFPFLSSYLDVVKQNYGAGLEQLDFAGNPEAARKQINDWVAENTNNRIENIVPEGALSADTRLVLTNAVYFKNAWQFQFQPQATQDAPFTLLDNSQVTVKMMQQQKSFGYAKGADYQIVSLPYAGGKMSMLIILPDTGKFADVEGRLDAKMLHAMKEDPSFKYALVRLNMPRFTFTYDLSLTQKLNAMGMPDAFDPVAANFSGMAEVKPDANLFISSVLHKAFIAVDETGTEAAAATAVMVGVTSAMPEEPIEVKLDHPFIFAIQDDETGSILFLGRVLNPTLEQ